MFEGMTKAERIAVRRLIDRQAVLAQLRDSELVRTLLHNEVEKIRSRARERAKVPA